MAGRGGCAGCVIGDALLAAFDTNRAPGDGNQTGERQFLKLAMYALEFHRLVIHCIV